MIAGIYSSLSGLAVASKKITTAAHNTANANTDSFKKQRALHQEVQPQGGVTTTIEQVNTPGPAIFRETENGLTQFEGSNVDLGEEAVNLLVGKRHYEANLRALDLQNETLGSVLDIIE